MSTIEVLMLIGAGALMHCGISRMVRLAFGSCRHDDRAATVPKKWSAEEGDFGTCNGKPYLKYTCPVCSGWVCDTGHDAQRYLRCSGCGFREGYEKESIIGGIEEACAKLRWIP